MAVNNGGWPRKQPVFTCLALALTLCWAGFVFHSWYMRKPPVDRANLWEYAAVSAFQDCEMCLGRTYSLYSLGPEGKLRVTHFATKSLTPQRYLSALQGTVYGGRSIYRVAAFPLWISGISGALLLAFGVYFDWRRRLASSPVRGSRFVSPWRYWRRKDPEDIEISLNGFLPSKICIRAEKLAQHIQISGVTGAGKTTVIRQIIHQIRERGDAAIIYDPKSEFLEEFWREGDTVANPLDQRTVYWALEEESNSAAHAEGVALGLWPNEPGQQSFFKKHPRAIFAYLAFRYSAKNTNHDPEQMATCANIAKWLDNPQKYLPLLLKGTRHADSRGRNSDQSQGLDTTLGEAVTPLSMMPKLGEGHTKWTARSWVKRRKGFVFITSTPDTQTALRPLQSLWIDMLILQLMATPRQPGEKRVWLIIDELADLQKLPELLSALTKQRASGNPVVLGFQDTGIINDLYGKETTRTLLGQAYTHLMFRGRDPETAKYQSALIGECQIDVIKESRTVGGLFASRNRTETVDRRIEPLVLASELYDLEDWHGFFLQRANVVPINVKMPPKEVREPRLIEREIPVEPIDDRPDPETKSSVNVFRESNVVSMKEAPALSVKDLL